MSDADFIPEAVDPEPEPEPEPQADTPEAPGLAEPHRRRRLLTFVLVPVLLLGAVGAGVGYTAVTVSGADRDAGAARWKFPAAPRDRPVHDKGRTGLKASLLPMPYGYEAGPDIAQFGADAELGGKQATALRKESLRFLPLRERRELEKEIDRQRIQAMVMRSYSSGNRADGGIIVDITLSRMGNRQAARQISRFESRFAEAMAVFRKGPKIKDHKDASCFLPPADKEEELDMMVCSGYSGDVLVTFTAYGTRKGLVSSGEPAELMREQLNIIESPGEAV
ncbi:hypothetical protein [Streptomyces sp. NBC_01445]|uniref:hypothetical protein n=1 Tax=Streptomyces sp. NBC_01445 TaxID=2903869 RepID=UPI002DD94F3C|nr:hypothetical protein [Streptomyces sp. NBC_01445]WSE06435.1 hypothetical protein OG574_25670 [Streptomyces sp. NBC_01445]